MKKKENYTRIIIEVSAPIGDNRKTTIETGRWDCDLEEMHELWLQALRGSGFMGVYEFYRDDGKMVGM